MSFVHGSLDVVVADPLINIPGEIFLLHPDQTQCPSAVGKWLHPRPIGPTGWFCLSSLAM